jgi:hypothetical protein
MEPTVKLSTGNASNYNVHKPMTVTTTVKHRYLWPWPSSDTSTIGCVRNMRTDICGSLPGLRIGYLQSGRRVLQMSLRQLK